MFRLPKIMPPENNDVTSTAGQPTLLHRRGVLRLLALTGAGLLAGGENSRAFFDFLGSYDDVPAGALKDLNIPADWRSILGSQLPNYALFLKKQGLRNVSVRQLLQPHTNVRGSVHNSLPPRAIWKNIRATLKVADSLADRLDLRLQTVISIYRSPAYNSRCPGAKSNSLHLRNNAMDIVFPCPPGKVAAMARAMRASGLFKGGVGRYGGFTHIDTRGANADW